MLRHAARRALSSAKPAPRVAIVGSGPGGFYTATTSAKIMSCTLSMRR